MHQQTDSHPNRQQLPGLQRAVLDRDAKCCEAGKLDACGACGGTGKLIDVQNV